MAHWHGCTVCGVEQAGKGSREGLPTSGLRVQAHTDDWGREGRSEPCTDPELTVDGCLRCTGGKFRALAGWSQLRYGFSWQIPSVTACTMIPLLNSGLKECLKCETCEPGWHPPKGVAGSTRKCYNCSSYISAKDRGCAWCQFFNTDSGIQQVVPQTRLSQPVCDGCLKVSSCFCNLCRLVRVGWNHTLFAFARTLRKAELERRKA